MLLNEVEKYSSTLYSIFINDVEDNFKIAVHKSLQVAENQQVQEIMKKTSYCCRTIWLAWKHEVILM